MLILRLYLRFPSVWVKNRDIEIKVLDQTMFLFYFEEEDDLLLVMQRAHMIWGLTLHHFGNKFMICHLIGIFSLFRKQLWKWLKFLRWINLRLLMALLGLRESRLILILDELWFLGLGFINWQSVRQYNVWINLRYERLPHFCFQCGFLTNDTKMCISMSGLNVGFDMRLWNFRDWLRFD